MDWSKLVASEHEVQPRTNLLGLCWWCDTPLPAIERERRPAVVASGVAAELHSECLAAWQAAISCPMVGAVERNSN